MVNIKAMLIAGLASLLAHVILLVLVWFSTSNTGPSTFSLGGAAQSNKTYQVAQLTLLAENIEPASTKKAKVTEAKKLKPTQPDTAIKVNLKPEIEPAESGDIQTPTAVSDTSDQAKEVPTKAEKTAKKGITDSKALTNQPATLAGDRKIRNTGLEEQGNNQIDAWNTYKRSVFDAINSQQRYPKQAKLRRLEGTIIVEFTVNKDGSLGKFLVVQATPAKILIRSANKLFNHLKLPEPPREISHLLPKELSIPLKYTLK